jgi:hypothetical protein
MRDAPADLRLRRLASALHRLGERPLYEFLREIEAGTDIRDRLRFTLGFPPGSCAPTAATSSRPLFSR